MKKKFISILLVLLLTLTSFASFGEVDITSKAALLMDYNTGKVIYALNENEKLPPASVTKIMTILLAMEAISNGRITLDQKVVISDYAAGMGGTQLYLEPGETQRVEDLIRAVIIRSANDASVALGECISGSTEAFVKLMNDKAKALEMENTHFSNPSGLPTEDHYTSAYDIALMSRELLKYDGLYKYYTSYMEDIVVGKKKNDTQTMVNTNKLIRDYEGATGIKTGSTNEAGFCISASAKRGDLQLIAVILGGQSSLIRFNEAKKLLDYGFANYNTVTLGKRNQTIVTLPVEKSDVKTIDLVLERDSYALLSKDNKEEIDKEILYPDKIESPISKGEAIGELVISLGGKEIDRINLVAKNDANSAGLILLLKRSITSFISGK